MEQQSTRKKLIDKLSSRKFLMSLIGIIIGILGIVGFSDNTMAIISFTILEAATIFVYILTEGHIDAKSVQASINLVEQVIELVEKNKNGEDIVIPENTTSIQSKKKEKLEK